MRDKTFAGLTGARPLDEAQLNLLSATLNSSPGVPLAALPSDVISFFKTHVSYLVYTQMVAFFPRDSPPRFAYMFRYFTQIPLLLGRSSGDRCCWQHVVDHFDINATATQEGMQQLACAIFQHKRTLSPRTHIALRSIVTWNVTSWQTEQHGVRTDKYLLKTRQVAKWLERGPVLLQETHWNEVGQQAVKLALPRVQVLSALAIPKSVHGTSGGVAVLLPTYRTGYASSSRILVPGFVLQVDIRCAGITTHLVT